MERRFLWWWRCPDDRNDLVRGGENEVKSWQRLPDADGNQDRVGAGAEDLRRTAIPQKLAQTRDLSFSFLATPI